MNILVATLSHFIFAGMFKRITAIILLLSFSVQSFSSPFIMIGYYTNTAAYARTCENKAKPKLHCNGKCQMMKKMQEEEKKDQQAPTQKTGYKLQVLSSRSSFSLLIIPYIISVKIFYSNRVSSPVDRAQGIFHPPQA